MPRARRRAARFFEERPWGRRRRSVLTCKTISPRSARRTTTAELHVAELDVVILCLQSDSARGGRTIVPGLGDLAVHLHRDRLALAGDLIGIPLPRRAHQLVTFSRYLDPGQFAVLERLAEEVTRAGRFFQVGHLYLIPRVAARAGADI